MNITSDVSGNYITCIIRQVLLSIKSNNYLPSVFHYAGDDSLLVTNMILRELLFTTVLKFKIA